MRDRWSRRVAVLALLAAHAVPCTASDPERPEQAWRNLCDEQVREQVKRRFGQEVERVEFRFRPYVSRGGYFRISEAFAYPLECPGYHYFEIHGDQYLCDGDVNAHSRAPVLYRSSGDGC